MKPYITALLTGIFLLILFCLQLYLFACKNYDLFNPTLLTFVFILFTNCSMTVLTLTALVLDSITFISSGLFGLTLLFLAPLSWLSLKIKNNMYNKIFLPCLFIIMYIIFYNISLCILLNYSWSISQMIRSILQNCIFFIIIWKISKQPFHN